MLILKMRSQIVDVLHSNWLQDQCLVMISTHCRLQISKKNIIIVINYIFDVLAEL